jgi:hypothetical protein
MNILSGLGSLLTAPVASVTPGVLTIIEMITAFVRSFGSIGR